METNSHNCKFCNKTFTQKKSLYVHCRKFHDTDILPDKPFKCEECEIQFSTQKTLTVHSYNIHKKNEKTKLQCRIICPIDICEEKDLKTYVKLREHLTYCHGLEIEYEEKHFGDISGNNFDILKRI